MCGREREVMRTEALSVHVERQRNREGDLDSRSLFVVHQCHVLVCHSEDADTCHVIQEKLLLKTTRKFPNG